MKATNSIVLFAIIFALAGCRPGDRKDSDDNNNATGGDGSDRPSLSETDQFRVREALRIENQQIPNFN